MFAWLPPWSEPIHPAHATSNVAMPRKIADKAEMVFSLKNFLILWNFSLMVVLIDYFIMVLVNDNIVVYDGAADPNGRQETRKGLVFFARGW